MRTRFDKSNPLHLDIEQAAYAKFGIPEKISSIEVFRYNGGKAFGIRYYGRTFYRIQDDILYDGTKDYILTFRELIKNR